MTVTPLRPPGRVSLVGAGPGDPELLTVRGLRRLREADCVLYDRLAGAALLTEVRPGCELMAVGKTPGAASPAAATPGAASPGAATSAAEALGAEATAQEEIHRLLVDRARRGLRVVRLKGGDPYIFGRGFEEVEALRTAGVEVEVIPGISSALAGPAAAGIPLTERLRAASFAVVTGHRAAAIEGDGDGDEGIDWPALARVDTLVVLMGVGRLRALCERLLACGKDPATPAAIVENATLPVQREVRARLDELAAAAEAAAIRAPAVLVVGPTVRLSAQTAGPRFAPTLDHSSISKPTRTASTGELR